MEKGNEEKTLIWWRDYDWNDFYVAQDEIIKKRGGKRPAIPYWPEIITFDTETSKLDFNPKKSENDKSIRAWKSWVYVWTMQVSDRISTILHFGNPYVVTDLPHIPRVLIGTCSVEGVNAGIEVLAGNYPAKGVLTYDITMK